MHQSRIHSSSSVSEEVVIRTPFSVLLYATNLFFIFCYPYTAQPHTTMEYFQQVVYHRILLLFVQVGEVLQT
jgi:hypothetical protein